MRGELFAEAGEDSRVREIQTAPSVEHSTSNIKCDDLLRCTEEKVSADC